MLAQTSQVFLYGLLTAIATGLGALPFLFVGDVAPRTVAIAESIAAGLMLGSDIERLFVKAGSGGGSGFGESPRSWRRGGTGGRVRRRVMLIFAGYVPEGMQSRMTVIRREEALSRIASPAS
jgi:zinc transporter ZupT